jgi:hypothetical protein
MPAIAAFYAGLIGILLVILALPISALRRRLKVGVGDGGDPVLARTIRGRNRAHMGCAHRARSLGYLGVRAFGVGLIGPLSSKKIEHGIEAAMIDRVHRFRANFWLRVIGDRNIGFP